MSDIFWSALRVILGLIIISFLNRLHEKRTISAFWAVALGYMGGALVYGLITGGLR